MKKSQSLLNSIGRRLAPAVLSAALLLTAATPAMAASSVSARLTPDRTIGSPSPVLCRHHIPPRPFHR